MFKLISTFLYQYTLQLYHTHKLKTVFALKLVSHLQGVSWMAQFTMCPTALQMAVRRARAR